MSMLIDLVLDACQYDAGECGDNVKFNEGLAAIQRYIGQDDGGIAALFFEDDIVKRWNDGDEMARAVILGHYISYECHYEWEAPDEMAEYNPKTDLFCQMEALPKSINSVIDRYTDMLGEGDFDGYMLCKLFLSEMKKLGYWFDFCLDASPFNLRKLD